VYICICAYIYICRVAHSMRGPTAHSAASLGYLFIYIHVYIFIYVYMVRVAQSMGGLTACGFVQLLRVFIYIYICIYIRIHIPLPAFCNRARAVVRIR